MSNNLPKTNAKKAVTDKILNKLDQTSYTNFDKVAIYSPESIFWEEVGRLSKGFNIVTNNKAESWLTLDGIRVVTPEEVAKEYGL